MISDEQYLLYETIEGLHKTWMPHEIQAQIAEAIFYKGIKNIFVCAGRNVGKTEIAAYCGWRWSKQNPESQNYIFEPYAKQGREILWASKRIQTFGPQEWVEGTNDTEMRLKFRNGSFIKVEGSDNSASMAGIKPKGLIVYDEAKDHRNESITNFEPNRAAFDVPALFIGTPPEFHNHFVDYMEMAKKSPDWLYIHAPTRSNPHISPKWLERKRLEMIAMGMEEDWLREYEAIFVKGGKKTIYPQWLKLKYKRLEEVVPIDLHKWILVVALDPAATSIFGGSIFLHNPFSKKIIVIDEIYESEPSKMTAREINRTIDEKIKPWKDKVKAIEYVYDESAAYFRNELIEISPEKWLSPSQKHNFGVDGYINLIRAILNAGLIEVVETCKYTIKEHEEYAKDDSGRIPKANDHCIYENEIIETDKGAIPIKNLSLNDKVLTRKGFKKVTCIMNNGNQETIELFFSDGRSLICTSDHKIYTENRGFVLASDLTSEDVLNSIKKWKQKKSFLTVLNIVRTQILKEKTCKIITDALRKYGKKQKLGIFIEQFGNFIMEKSKKAMRSITLMGTHTITVLKTCSVFQGTNTKTRIEKIKSKEEDLKSHLNTLIELGIYQNHGTALNKVKNGIKKMLKTFYLKIEQKKKQPASSVIKNIMQIVCAQKQNFAVQNVNQHTEENLALMILKYPVSFVKNCLLKTNMQKQDSALVLVYKRSTGIKQVYDITVEEEHEFYANGVLVHNCINAFQYGCASLGLNLDELEEPKQIPVEDQRRGFAMHEDFDFNTSYKEIE